MVRVAEEFMAPSLIIYQGIHDGKMQKSGSLMSIDNSNIIVSSVKLAEDGNDLIIRCVETNGTSVDANLNLSFASRKWNGKFRPYEIKTLRMNRKSGEIREVNLLEE